MGFTDRPAYANAREIAEDLMSAYVDGDLDQVEIFYNGYVSPLTQEVRRETLLPLQHATILEAEDEGEDDTGHHALVEYEPDPEQILHRLIPDYVEISVFRALLESTASEHGARMTAMRNASDNAGDLIEGLTLQMNRARQAEITQEIMEVVAGARRSDDLPARLGFGGEAVLDCRRRLDLGDNGSRNADEERGPHRGDPGRRDRGRLPGQAA